ncbi:hypothetical protein BH23CHL5_BH23CHL5_07330 [soil metagenome]
MEVAMIERTMPVETGDETVAAAETTSAEPEVTEMHAETTAPIEPAEAAAAEADDAALSIDPSDEASVSDANTELIAEEADDIGSMQAEGLSPEPAGDGSDDAVEPTHPPDADEVAPEVTAEAITDAIESHHAPESPDGAIDEPAADLSAEAVTDEIDTGSQQPQADSPESDAPADDVTAKTLTDTVEADVAAIEEPAVAKPDAASGPEASTDIKSAPEGSEPVLAADAIAAPAKAVAEAQAEEDRTPVVVAQELTWGFVDTVGRVHQKTTEHFRGRAIGKIAGSGELQIAEFESNFGPLLKEVEILESDAVSAKNKVAVIGRVRKIKGSAGRAEALGDFDSLFARLNALEQQLQGEIEERRAAKEALIEQAEAIKESTDWKVTGEAYKALFLQWKEVGATGREADDSLWARFIGAREYFNTRRGEHFNQRQEQWEANRLLKQDVIVHAHELSISDQWRPTGDALRALFDEWKKIGSAGRQSDEELWQQFRGAQQHFYDRRNAAYEDNKQRKESLCQRAEELRESKEWEATVEEMKALMAEWKTVGTSGKRDIDDVLWNRFRGAQNQFFDRRYAETSAREQEERSQSQRKEEIAIQIESLAYSPDPVAAADEAAALRAQFDALPPIRRDREEALQRRIRKTMGDIRVNAAAEGARRSVSWQGKLREALDRSQGQIESLKATVASQEASLDALKASIAAASEDEKAPLEQQLQELFESISYNQAEITRLSGSMTEISDSVNAT